MLFKYTPSGMAPCIDTHTSSASKNASSTQKPTINSTSTSNKRAQIIARLEQSQSGGGSSTKGNRAEGVDSSTGRRNTGGATAGVGAVGRVSSFNGRQSGQRKDNSRELHFCNSECYELLLTRYLFLDKKSNKIKKKRNKGKT